jgi:hypothetical protein
VARFYSDAPRAVHNWVIELGPIPYTDNADTPEWDGGENYPCDFDRNDYWNEEAAGHGEGLQSVSPDTTWTPREFPAMSDADWEMAATDEAARDYAVGTVDGDVAWSWVAPF